MRVGVIGLGHVGLVSAACFAHLGHEVVGVDADAERVEGLRQGRLPFFEPGLAELLEEGLSSGRLRVREEVEAAVRASPIVLICVGTPSRPSGEADLVQVERLAREIAGHLEGYRVLAEKSTVPIRTADRIARTVSRSAGDRPFDVISTPEFLRQGSAIADTLEPDRIVIGSGSRRATDIALQLYRPIIERSGCPVILTDVGTAELIKHASNAFLATKISFVNALAEVCERTGADVDDVARGMGLDPRIGPAFLRPGIGYGGSCLPKDVAAFQALAEQVGTGFRLLAEVQAINERGPARVVEKLRQELWHLEGKAVAVLGLAFKPGTDDLRGAPSLKLIEALQAEGADLVAFDPVAMPAAKHVLSNVRFASSALEAATGADAAVFVTDWNEFRGLDLDALRAAMRLPVIVDGRNLFRPEEMRRAGFAYHSIGRVPVGL
ncbi:UDP-glucose/GDP-mannose dehydrogenase family protein [soil metagenome]|nr:UDP-glucose/GDP-mannose dehydrogenase family protein [Actinomycetota bacterium]